MQGTGVGMAAWWIDIDSPENKPFHPTYGWSLILGAVSAGLYLIASIWCGVSSSLEKYPPSHMQGGDVRYDELKAVAEA